MSNHLQKGFEGSEEQYAKLLDAAKTQVAEWGLNFEVPDQREARNSSFNMKSPVLVVYAHRALTHLSDD